MNIVFVLLIDSILIYILIGTFCYGYAAIKSKKENFHEKEMLIFLKIIFMWAWKYRELRRKLEE